MSSHLISSIAVNFMQHPVRQALNREELKKIPEMGRTTSVPNDLLYRVMPMLRDTELRVLLVAVRQTLGWQSGTNPARRKERDWLTQSQLMRRTGRASGAVAHAVDALVQAGLIIVTDRAGMPVKAPDERRRHLGRLYYQLGSGGERVDKWSKNVDNPRKSEHAKAHTTKETVTQKHKGSKQMQSNLKQMQNNSTEKPFVIRSNRFTRAVEVNPSHNFTG